MKTDNDDDDDVVKSGLRKIMPRGVQNRGGHIKHQSLIRFILQENTLLQH